MGIANITNNVLTDSGLDTSSFLTTSAAASTYVPYTGATSSLDVGTNDLSGRYLNAEGSGGLGGVLNIKQDAVYLPKGNGYSSIASSFTDLDFFGYTGASTYKNFTLKFDELTDNTRRRYTLPDTDGTLALTSNLGAYLPLTGGTLTGALNGTSASFTGAVTSVGGIINGSDFRYNPLGNTNGNPVIVLKNPTTGVLSIASEIIGEAFVNSNSLEFAVSNTSLGRFTALTLASTGAATFSSSVGIGPVTTFPSGESLLIRNSGVWNVSLSLDNTGTSGRKWSIFSTNTSFSQGAGKLLFYNATAGSDAMVIDSSNNVGIGTTSPSRKFVVSNSGANGLEITAVSSGTIMEIISFNRSTSVYTPLQLQASSYNFVQGAATFSSTVTATNFITTSDRRLKSEIKEIKDAVSKLSKFKAYEYIKDDKQDAGFIAQEVQEVIPYSINTMDNGYLSMNDRPILALLHQAIIEINERLTKLENK
jgi:hypothetical protein